MSEAAVSTTLDFPSGRLCLNCGLPVRFDETKPYTDCSCQLRYSNRVLINISDDRWEELRMNRQFVLTFSSPEELMPPGEVSG